ncbi:MAG: histidine kinase dimerization/phosphoacceptor domain-containing protein [Chloroflexota bacterium]
MVVIWAVGDQVPSARERRERELERAREIDRQREANARMGAMAERHRIARELHDVVAHGLAVMIVQADGALYAEAEHPEVLAPGAHDHRRHRARVAGRDAAAPGRPAR